VSRVEHRVRERVARSAVDLGAVQQLRRNHLRVEHRGIVKIVVQDRPREYARRTPCRCMAIFTTRCGVSSK